MTTMKNTFLRYFFLIFIWISLCLTPIASAGILKKAVGAAAALDAVALSALAVAVTAAVMAVNNQNYTYHLSDVRTRLDKHPILGPFAVMKALQKIAASYPSKTEAAQQVAIDLGFDPQKVVMAQSNNSSETSALSKATIEELLPNCRSVSTRTHAMLSAYAFAYIPVNGGLGYDPISWANFTRPKGINDGSNAWIEFKHLYNDPPVYGWKASYGKKKAQVVEHPLGHPDVPGAEHHQCPHFESRDEWGRTRIFTYKPGL
jgi:hypothetical protein